MDKALTILLRAGWFVAVIAILAEMIFQMPSTAANDGLVFVVMWAMITPLLKVPEGEARWAHLGRGLLGGLAVWLFSAIKSRTLGQQPHVAMELFSVGVLLFALVGWIVQLRQQRAAHKS